MPGSCPCCVTVSSTTSLSQSSRMSCTCCTWPLSPRPCATDGCASGSSRRLAALGGQHQASLFIQANISTSPVPCSARSHEAPRPTSRFPARCCRCVGPLCAPGEPLQHGMVPGSTGCSGTGRSAQAMRWPRASGTRRATHRPLQKFRPHAGVGIVHHLHLPGWAVANLNAELLAQLAAQGFARWSHPPPILPPGNSHSRRRPLPCGRVVSRNWPSGRTSTPTATSVTSRSLIASCLVPSKLPSHAARA